MTISVYLAILWSVSGWGNGWTSVFTSPRGTWGYKNIGTYLRQLKQPVDKPFPTSTHGLTQWGYLRMRKRGWWGNHLIIRLKVSIQREIFPVARHVSFVKPQCKHNWPYQHKAFHHRLLTITICKTDAMVLHPCWANPSLWRYFKGVWQPEQNWYASLKSPQRRLYDIRIIRVDENTFILIFLWWEKSEAFIWMQ